MMVVEPIDYSASTGRALLQGLTAGRAIQGMRQASQEMDATNAAAERQKLFTTALQNTPPDQLHKLRTDFPEYADLVQKEIGIQDAEHATFVNKALNKISIAVASGNPAMVQTAIEQNKPALMSFGVDPQEAIQMAQNDPRQFGSLLKASMYATMPIEKQVDVQQNQQKIEETARSNRAGEAVQWANNSIAQQNVNIRKMELDDKKYDRQIARETNDLKLAELKDKRQQNQQEITRVKQERDSGYDTQREGLQETLDLIGDLKTDKEGRYGGLEGQAGILPRVPGTVGAAYRDKVERLNAMLSLDKSGVLKGTLSESDMKLVRNAASGLNTSMPTDAFDKRLNAIQQKIENAASRIPVTDSYTQRNYPGAPQIGTVDGGHVFLGGDPSNSKNWKAQ